MSSHTVGPFWFGPLTREEIASKIIGGAFSNPGELGK